MDLNRVSDEDIFEVSESKFTFIRQSVPRAVGEYNSHNQLGKNGTDVQVSHDKFSKLLDYYRKFSQLGIRYIL